MAPHDVFPLAIYPSAGSERCCSEINQVLSREKRELAYLEKRATAIKGLVTRRRNNIEAKRAISNDPSNAMAYSASHQVKKLVKQLREDEEERDSLPQRIEEQKKIVADVKEELAQATFREAQEARKREATKATRSVGDAPSGRKRKSSIFEEESSLKKRRMEAPASSEANAVTPSCLPGEKDTRGVKRPADDDEDPDPPTKRHRRSLGNTAQPQSGVSSTGSKSPPARRRQLHGLANHQLACFSATIIQIVDAALVGHDIDKILGPKTDGLENFGLSAGDALRFDKEKYDIEKQQDLTVKQKRVRKAIRTAAAAGETQKVSTSKHLRNLMAELDQEFPTEDVSEKVTSPFLFQNVFAYGVSKDSDGKTQAGDTGRVMMNGDTQEDALEYYQSVLDVLVRDPHVGDANALKDLFKFTTNLRDTCHECAYKSEARQSELNCHEIPVPVMEDGASCGLRDLWKKSLKSETDRQCPECSEGNLVTTATFPLLSDNFVMKLNRTQYGPHGAFKVETPVALDMLEMRGKKPKDGSPCRKLELSAVVFHKGSSPDSGHYTIFRKHFGDWFILDDKECLKISADAVKDSRKYGQATMLLYKKVQPEGVSDSSKT